MNKLVLLGCVFAATACGDDSGGGGTPNTTGIPDECNPLGGQGCLLPWPSATYLADDASAVSGYRIDIPHDAMPYNVDRTVVEPTLLARFDGFSPSGPLLAAFPTGVSADGLPSFKDPDASLAPSSPVVLVAIDSGERVPLFAEVDQNIPDITKRDLIIRPLARLQGGTRYVAVVRKAVKAADGSELPSPPGFAALRDGTPFSHPRFAELAKRWPAYFTKLGELGIDKSDIVLAWDFVTASDEMMRGDLTSMRTDALPAFGTGGANLGFTITSTEPNVTQSYKRYLGTFKSPDFLTAGETDASVIRRDETGRPQMQGLRDARFAAIIPACVQTQPLPRPVIVFGHGLFGSSKGYLSDGFTLDLAETNCFIVLAGDFIGLTDHQLQLAPLAVNDMNRAPQIAEKLGQSVIDFMALGSLARGKLATAPEFQFNGAPVIDPTKVFYVGGSLGGTMGGVIMAYDPGFQKGVLAVPGGVWSMLFERSAAWFALMGATQGSYEEPAFYQLVIAFLGFALEPYDPITTASHITHDPLFPDQSAKDILMWYGLGDSVVTNIATEEIAREMQLPVIAPSVKVPWGLHEEPGPLSTGLLVLDQHPTPLPPDTNVPPSGDNGSHGGVNRNGAALREVQQFLLQDQITATCSDGNQPVPCDCNPGGGGVCD